MAYLGSHCQTSGPPHARGWIKLLDGLLPEHYDPYPEAIIIGRTYEPDEESIARIWKGAAGADEWMAKWARFYAARPYVHAWEGPNEPHPMSNVAFADCMVEFYIRLVQHFDSARWKLVGGNWSDGWPFLQAFDDPAPRARRYGPMVQALAYGGHYLGLHAYSAPVMSNMAGAHTLRYRPTIAELREAGYQTPPVLLTETGIDGGVIGQHRCGWKSFIPAGVNAEEWYREQLAWYKAELDKDEYVKAAFVFTYGPNQDWMDFDVTPTLAQVIDDLNQTVPAPIGVPVAGPPKPPIIDLVDSLPKHAELKYSPRKRTQIERVVIHHSATVQKVISREATIRHITAIARGHRALGWPGIGYHYVIGPGGLIYQTNRLETVSYHVGGHNTTSVGVCMLGDFTRSDPTENQLASARALVAWLGWPVVPHKALNQTRCPGDWAGWGSQITTKG